MWFAQTEGTSNLSNLGLGNQDVIALFASVAIVFVLAVLIFAVLYLIAYWKLFIKAGRPGWFALITFMLFKQMNRSRSTYISTGVPLSYVALAALSSLTLRSSIIMTAFERSLRSGSGRSTGST